MRIELTTNAFEGPEALDASELPGKDEFLPSSRLSNFVGRLLGSLVSSTELLCKFKYALLLWADLSTTLLTASGMPDDIWGAVCYIWTVKYQYNE